MRNQEFNLVIAGVGGQGLITLLRIVSEAALIQGFDVKTSELHGLSQRGGSMEVHARFGKNVFSPLVRQGGADLLIALELQEALRACYYASQEKTIFLLNDFFSPVLKGEILKKEEVLKNLEDFSKEKILIAASEICKKEIGKEVLAGVFLLSYASFKDLIPLRTVSISKAIEKIIPEKYLQINKKAFELAKIQTKQCHAFSTTPKK